MTSSGMDSNTSSLTDPGGNEAIVLVMEYCDRGSLKEAIQDGSFLQKETLTHVISLHKHQQQGGQQQQQQQQHVQQMAALARGGMGLINMKAVYSTLLEVALALRHMHGLHMVHCDLKPQNVLLKSSPRDPRGFTAKLSDFGLAKMMAHDEEGQLVIDDAIQSGTLTHLPPEALIGGRQLGPTVDIYAFGIVMFQMLCGMTVYRGLDLKQIIRGVVLQGLRPTVPAWVPQGYRDLAQRCWHDRPSCRPTSLQLVSELEALLEACDGQQGTLNRHGFASTGGSVGSIRLGTGGCVSDPAKHHRLPHRCATDTAIQGRRLPQTAATGSPMPRTIVVATENAVVIAAGSSGGGGGGDAVTNNVALLPPQLPAALFRHPPVDVYHPPQSLYQPHSTGAGSQPPTEGPGVVSVVDLGLRPGTVPSSVHPGGVGGRMAAFHPAPLPLPAAAVALLNQTSLYTLTLPAATSPPAPPASPQPTPHPMLLTP
ncbi:hypothetical protein Vafri_17394 [Volvox africanus]|uniref:Protein kinase domain-containing protein n=1 Tax=Volvox africanus TaxID=51714 RepID=A0A8J4BLW1_9CHLO|nr:hypothetical protein Vafri_17394 [Volvox africanus]